MSCKSYTTEANVPYWKIYRRLSDATHLLIAGTTGAGKSTVMGGIINTMLTLESPASVRYILIDPKRTELKPFKDVSDFCLGYTHDSKEALHFLRYVINEIEERYQLMDERNIRKWDVETCGPRLIVIIDELADLMISAEGKAIRAALQKILQIGRACAVSVWAATQAPSRQIIPAEVTLNFTDRVALRCVSAIESRQIVGVKGAEQLPKYGKGIYFSPDGLEEISLPYVGEDEIQARLDWWEKNPGEEIKD